MARYGLWSLRKLLVAAARGLIGSITHVSTRDAVAALTFDDGPHPEYTPRLLDILERYQARATFFMVGEAAKRHPDLVSQVARAGHVVGNHTWDHPSFPLLSSSERRGQFRAWELATAPHGQRLFRPPYGHQSVASCLDAKRFGYDIVHWSLAARDWLDHDAEWMAARLVDQIQPGSVVLFHDALYSYTDERYVDRGPMLEAVNIVLEQLCDRFRFVTVPDLLQHGRPQRRIRCDRKPNPDWERVKDHKRQYDDPLPMPTAVGTSRRRLGHE